MNGLLRSVTVYCSSSRHIAPAYFDAARLLGRSIAESGWNLVYGGNDLGLMGAVANAARDAGGKVIGVTPRLLVDQGAADEKCDELIVTDGMRERKAMLEARGDAFVALPGGLGTLEEISEILVGKMLGYHAKPIVLIDVSGFYAPLVALIDHMIEQQFAKPRIRDLFFRAKSVADAIECLKASGPELKLREPSAAARVD